VSQAINQYLWDQKVDTHLGRLCQGRDEISITVLAGVATSSRTWSALDDLASQGNFFADNESLGFGDSRECKGLFLFQHGIMLSRSIQTRRWMRFFGFINDGGPWPEIDKYSLPWVIVEPKDRYITLVGVSPASHNDINNTLG
jgi:hypothetical protein